MFKKIRSKFPVSLFFRWLYLEPILSGEEGELGAKFHRVDQGYRQVTHTIENDARLSALLQSPRLQPILDSILNQLAVCQSALNSYIDEKRLVFPRFYFLSDDDLLELLGQARAGAEGHEAVMQTHLKKLFPGLSAVTLGPNKMSITALCSLQEKFLLDRPVDIDCPVEVWLKNLEGEMRKSLKDAVLKCLLDKTFQYQDAFSFPTQILCLAQNIRFTEQVERGIVAKDLHRLKENIQKECNHYIEVDNSEEEGERIKKRALILQCSCYLNVLQTLIENNVASTSHWLWQKQLRFYLLSNKEIVARMGLAQISYSYEYLGINTGQFVRTELTDQCFLIMTQAFHLGLVGNPFGPAGTGKTESVKALGGLVGRLVLVFNCDEAMDAIAMGRLLTGLALSGAWGCFDEFNRLTAETLSAISHQFSSLLAAMGSRAKSIGNQSAAASLNGKEVTVSEWCGVVVTLNPVGRGYGGRRELPAALARLLRPAAMCRPAAAPLAHHLLAARALSQPREMAYALAQVFNMARDLLSSQQHYDWGLRALKTVVGSCGRAVEEARSRGGGALSEHDQRAIVLRAARLNTTSKLTYSDALRFDAILAMAFPEASQELEGDSILDAALLNSYTALDLVYKKEQVQKCKELHEQLLQRMGVVIVGPPGSGKTAIRQLLKNALNQQGNNVIEHVICPKAMSRTLLMGHIDHDTRQWTDGVISATALEVSNQSSEVWSWIVCDGDVDPEWIESLNSVLDDNRLLTLPSGWRIQFGPNVNFVFETHSLEHASPATISRMGVILLSDEDSCAGECLDRWMSRVDAENELARLALPLLQRTINKCLDWSKAHRNEFVQKLFSVAVVRQVLNQYDYIVHSLRTNLMGMTTSEDIVSLAIRRGLSGSVKPKMSEKFMDEVCGDHGYVNTEERSEGGWRDRLYLSPRLVRASRTLSAAVHSNAHVLIIGPNACAKNMLAEHVIKEANDKMMISINCTPTLEPANIIDELKRNNVVRAGSVRSKSVNDSQVVLLVKCLHRARVDAWGTSALQAFLLQLIQHGGYWERNKTSGERDGGMQWCSVRALQVVMTVCYQGARLCPRLTNVASLILLREPDDEELSELAFAGLCRNVKSKAIQEEQIRKIATNMLNLHKEISETFFSQPHYKWNTADLAKWCDNIQWYEPTDLDTLLQAVYAEAHNIFRNRLVNEADASKFDSIKHNHLMNVNTEGMHFAPKLHRDGVFLELVKYEEWCGSMQKVINQCITESEQSIFGDSGAEVCREIATLCSAIARSVNGEVVVCVGSAGMGRRAAAHIVSTMLPAKLYTVREAKDFNQHIKNALSSAGTEACKTIVVVEESVNRSIEFSALGSIEAICQATSVTHLPDALQPATNQQAGAPFLNGVKQNLGIVIILDKNDDHLTDLLEKYPLLYQRSHMLWLDRWGDETLRRMPQLMIQRLVKENISDDPEDDKAIPLDGFVAIHSSLTSEVMLPPCRYVNLVKTYYYISKAKKRFLVKRQETLRAGVAALTKARTEVNTLKLDAARQEMALSEKQDKATQALNQISATVHSATDHKEEMQALKKNIELENAKLQVRKMEIEQELASVEPIISAARSAVGDIKTEALSEVRSLRAPPDVVRDVLEGVLRLMGIADTSWHSMKSFLSKRGVKEDIRNLDASQITFESLRSVERLLEQRGSSFEDKTSKRASAACAPLAAWVRANVAYAGALQRVQPLQQQQKALFKNLEEAEAQLVALSSGLQSVDERVASLKEQLNRYTKEGMEIEIKLSAAKETITKTEALVDKLSEEYDTWERDLENISKEIGEVNVRSLVAAAFVVYLSDVPEDQSKYFMDQWCKALGFDGVHFSVVNFLSSIEEQLKWNANGLPLDISAVKNAVIVNQALQTVRCGFTPLIIDPDGDASAWLKNHLSEFPCDFIPQHSDKLCTAIQHATRFGKVLVVEEVTNIDDHWAPLLRGLAITAQSTLHAGFKLILYSRDVMLPSRLRPHHRATLSIIDFTPKLDGLTDQLMHFALQHEKPEINNKLNALKVQKASLQKQQHELQENLLKDLTSNKDILQDSNLLSSLSSTRATSATIVQALNEAKTVESQMRSMYDKFELAARRAAILLLGVREIAAGKYPLVSVPVETLMAVFVEALEVGKVADKPDTMDSEQVVKHLTTRIMERVMLSLHKQDKYIIMLYLVHCLYDNIIPDKLWKLFIGTNSNIDDGIANEIKSKLPWISAENVPSVTNLKLAAPELYDKLKLDDRDLWTKFLSSGDLNSIARLNLTAFEKVVMVQAVRPESLYVAVTQLVVNILGASASVCRDSGGVEAGARWGGGGAGRAPRPILLLGTHAADQLAAYAHAHAHTLRQVWVTGDAEQSARELSAALEVARGGGGAGGWVVLQIGAAPFTAHLQTYITTFCLQKQEEQFHPDFRFWIVSEDRNIPSLIANTCVNVMLEAPEGVRNNIVHSLSAWGNYESHDMKAVRMLFCLAILHAVIQERRAYTPQGWTQWYPFEWGDISAGHSIITTSSSQGSLNSVTAAGLCEALYAGRISSRADGQILATLVRELLGEQTFAHAWTPRGLNTTLPFARQLQAYNSALMAFPLTDSPAQLGLAANARVAWEKQQAHKIITGLRDLNTVRRHDAGNMKPVLSLWKRLMSGSALLKGDYNIDKSLEGWWGAVVAGEVTTAARTCALVHNTLAQATRAQATLTHLVPEEWQVVWAGPELVTKYIRELCHRAAEATKRLDSFKQGDDIPTDVDLRSLFNPRRLIAALKATAAQSNKCSPDSLVLNTKWSKEALGRGDAAGCAVRGLLLEGAAWSDGAQSLTAAAADDPPRSHVPPIMLHYTPQSGNSAPPSGVTEVPVYSNERREEALFSLRVPLSSTAPYNRSTLVLNAVALVVGDVA